MDKQQFYKQLTKTSKALLRERERERVNNARGILYRQNFNKHPFWGAFCILIFLFIFAQTVFADNESKDVIISGKTLPAIEVVASIDNQEETKGISNEDGEFRLEIKDTSQGIHDLTLFAIDKQNRKSDVIQTTFSVPRSDPPEAVGKIEISGFELLFQNQECASNPDLNHDGKITLVDLSILAYRWGSADCEADLNGNGEVDLADFSIFLGIWSKFAELINLINK